MVQLCWKLSVPGHPTYLENSRPRANRACSRCESGVGCVCEGGGRGGGEIIGHFFSRLSFLFSFSLSGRRPDID